MRGEDPLASLLCRRRLSCAQSEATTIDSGGGGQVEQAVYPEHLRTAALALRSGRLADEGTTARLRASVQPHDAVAMGVQQRAWSSNRTG
jgi:hypothetical protein